MNSGFGQRQKVPNHWWQIAHFRMMIVDLIFVDRKSNRRRIKVYHVLVMSDELGAGWSTASSPLRPESDSSLVAGSIVGGSDKKMWRKPWTNKKMIRKLLATNLIHHLLLSPKKISLFIVEVVPKSWSVTCCIHVRGTNQRLPVVSESF